MIDSLNQVSEERAVLPARCEFLTGRAGTGKSYLAVKDAGSTTVLCATTGIAAVNLGSITINSILHYFDTVSMRDAYLSGQLGRTLHEIAREKRMIAIDECSMLDAEQLDLLVRAADEVGRYVDVPESLTIRLVGDFAQLPPVRARWAFDADTWPRFAQNTTRLTKVWRQDGGLFLDALNLAREGRGSEAEAVLTSAGLEWHTALATEFEGTTILPKNDMVSRYNALALQRTPGKAFVVRSERWGRQRREWGLSPSTKEWGIPPEAEFKIGSYVMCLSNTPDFTMVNGDCGHVRQYDAETDTIHVELVRTGKTEAVRPIVRGFEVASEPPDWPPKAKRVSREDEEDGEWLPEPHYRISKRHYVIGQVRYYPLRLAYASTVHKAQGLTLDRVQVDVRDQFFGQPAMCYVALSRCRTLEGLRVVGQRERFAKRVAMDPRVRRWL